MSCATCCQRPAAYNRDELNEKSDKESLYDNLPLRILFPITFFCAMTGIALLCRSSLGGEPIDESCTSGDPCAAVSHLNVYLIIGALITGIAGITGIASAILVCYIHSKNFDRTQLPYLTIDHQLSSRQLQKMKKKTEHSGSILSTSKVRPQTLNVIPKIQVSSTPEVHSESSYTTCSGSSHQASSSAEQTSGVTQHQGADNHIHSTEEHFGVVPSPSSQPAEHYERRNTLQGRLEPITEAQSPRHGTQAIDNNEENTHL